jgi:hypothetical protein
MTKKDINNCYSGILSVGKNSKKRDFLLFKVIIHI